MKECPMIRKWGECTITGCGVCCRNFIIKKENEKIDYIISIIMDEWHSKYTTYNVNSYAVEFRKSNTINDMAWFTSSALKRAILTYSNK
jgi:hypothetical protein